jgi:hypothetical protein
VAAVERDSLGRAQKKSNNSFDGETDEGGEASMVNTYLFSSAESYLEVNDSSAES